MAYNDVNDTKELAKEKATEVAQTAQSAAGDVATTAKQQAQAFTDEAKYHARQLFGTTRQQLSEQAEQRTQEASKGLHRLADQVQALGEGRPQDAGPVGDWARQLQTRLRQWATRLDSGGVDGAARDLSSFARRRPLVFLGGCMAAGVVVGRLVKDVAGVEGQTAGSEQRTSRPGLTDGRREVALPPPDGPSLIEQPASMGSTMGAGTIP
jgi:hypothetical protein